MREEFRAELSADSSKVFKLKDVFFPECDDVISQATPDLKLRGKIIDFSDSGQGKKEFAILQVEGIQGPVIVPVEKLRAVWDEDQADAQVSE